MRAPRPLPVLPPADAFSAALSRTYLEPPDLGLGAMADDARARADGYREAAGMLADAAGRPLAQLAGAEGCRDRHREPRRRPRWRMRLPQPMPCTTGLNDTATAAEARAAPRARPVPLPPRARTRP